MTPIPTDLVQSSQDTSAAPSEAAVANLDVGSNDGLVELPVDGEKVVVSEPEPSHPGNAFESLQENGHTIQDIDTAADDVIQGPLAKQAGTIEPVVVGIQDLIDHVLNLNQEQVVDIRTDQHLGAAEIKSVEDEMTDAAETTITNANAIAEVAEYSLSLVP